MSDIPENVTTNKHYIQSILTQTIIGKSVNYFPDITPWLLKWHFDGNYSAGVTRKVLKAF